MNEDKVAGMDMPCQCDCGNFFDLNDGYSSHFKSTGVSSLKQVICEDCHIKEEDYIELQSDIEGLENEIEEFEGSISQAEEDIEYWKKQIYTAQNKLEDLKVDLSRMDI